MQLSSKALLFHEQKLKETLILTNNNSHKLIFKIKVTNTQIFHIVPGKGFIDGQEHLQVQIVLKYHSDLTAKLLIMYAPALHQSENFDTVWNSLDKHSIKDQLVTISVTQSAPQNTAMGGKTENSSKNQVTFKQTQSPVFEHELQKSKSQISNSSSRQMKQQNPEGGTCLKNSEKMSQVLRQTERTISVPSSLAYGALIDRSQANLSHLQKQLKNQRDQNKKLRERLVEREKKLRFYQEVSQKAVNETFKVKQQPFELNYCNICLLMLICLIFGFTIARNQFSEGLQA